MSTYTSTPAVVNRPAIDIFNHFADLTLFESRLESLPDEARAKLNGVIFQKDAIIVQTPQIGELRFEVIERIEHQKIIFGSPSSPVPLKMEVLLKELTPDSTEVQTQIDVEIPMMLRPFVGPKMQEAANKFGEMITNLAK